MSPSLLLVLLPGCDAWHDMWFSAEKAAPTPDDSQPVADCTWFADDANCWQQVVTAARDCTPLGGRVGALQDDITKDTAAPETFTQCLYDEKKPTTDFMVTFDEPATIPLAQDQTDVPFTLFDQKGEVCVKVTWESDDDFTLTVRDQTVFRQTTVDGVPTWTCPDKTTISPTFQELSECNTGDSRVPGVALQSTGDEIGAQLVGTVGDPLVVFNCAWEPPADTGK